MWNVLVSKYRIREAKYDTHKNFNFIRENKNEIKTIRNEMVQEIYYFININLEGATLQHKF